jgi:hypothetical protein
MTGALREGLPPFDQPVRSIRRIGVGARDVRCVEGPVPPTWERRPARALTEDGARRTVQVVSVQIHADGALRYAVFHLPPGPEDVYVAGDWNGWSTRADRFRPARRGRRAVVQLEPGRHEYRFVTASGVWFDDPSADRCGENCLLDVPGPESHPLRMG